MEKWLLRSLKINGSPLLNWSSDEKQKKKKNADMIFIRPSLIELYLIEQNKRKARSFVCNKKQQQAKSCDSCFTMIYRYPQCSSSALLSLHFTWTQVLQTSTNSKKSTTVFVIVQKKILKIQQFHKVFQVDKPRK